LRHLAAATLLVAATACGGGDRPAAAPTTTAPARRVTPPAPRPTATRAPARTPTATPTPTSPPPVTGDVVGTNGALLALAPAGPARKVTGTPDCAAVFPDLATVRCGSLTLDGGSLLWATGDAAGVPVVRLLVLDTAAGGYVPRYEGRDEARRWVGVRVDRAALTGRGDDAVVVVARHQGGVAGQASYDVLTWVKGGPLVLRATRSALADGRVAIRAAWLDEYAARGNGTFARRRMAWDGRYFRLAPTVVAPGAEAPPA
jgi:hypothetical protein